MSERYPEWFVGGPWHGRDKRKECPERHGSITVAIPRFPAPMMSAYYTEPSADPMMEIERITYYPKTFMIFDTTLVAWIPDAAGLGRWELSTSETSRLLRELILSPHDQSAGEPAFDVSTVVQAQRQRFELVGEARHEIAERYEARIRQLEDTVASLNRQLRARTDGVVFTHYDANVDGAAIQLEFKLPDEFGGNHSHTRITKTVIYRYGSGEYVATAQPEDRSAVTGIGDDPKAALLAMACDALGYVGEFTKRSK